MTEQESAEDAGEAPSEDLLTRTRELLSHVKLLDIRPCSISASMEQGVAPATHIADVVIELAMSFAIAEGFLGNRFDYGFLLKGDEEDELLGTIEFSLLIDYEVDDDYEVDADAAEFLMASTGHFAAYPYARELFQSLASRLQFDPIVLGLIRRGTLKPGTVSLVRGSGMEP